MLNFHGNIQKFPCPQLTLTQQIFKLENVLFSLSRIKDSKTPSHLLRVNQPKLKLNTAQLSLFIPLGGKFLLVKVSIKHSQNLNKQMYPVHIQDSHPDKCYPGKCHCSIVIAPKPTSIIRERSLMYT